MDHKQRMELLRKDVAEWTDAEVIDVLTDRYTQPDVPKCHICGEPMSVSAFGMGRITYACDTREDDPDTPGERRLKPGRSFVDDHYSRSRVEMVDTADGLVLELIRRFRAAAPDPAGQGDV